MVLATHASAEVAVWYSELIASSVQQLSKLIYRGKSQFGNSQSIVSLP
jgi:hypothetical protein